MASVEVISTSSYQTIAEISCLQLHTKETELIIQQTRKQLLSKIPLEGNSCHHKATSIAQYNKITKTSHFHERDYKQLLVEAVNCLVNSYSGKSSFTFHTPERSAIGLSF